MKKLSILIPTIGERDEKFRRLVGRLQPQVAAHRGVIEVVCYWSNFELPIAAIRQALIEEAIGLYVCFIDDDDDVPTYYCDRIIEAIAASPSYVGWRQQLWYDGRKTKPTYHSLRYDRWWEDSKGYYRNTSHLNPVRRDISLQVGFVDHSGPEDVAWASGAAKLCKTEVYIDAPMYFYHYSTRDSTWRGRPQPTESYTRPTLPEHFRYHPDCRESYP